MTKKIQPEPPEQGQRLAGGYDYPEKLLIVGVDAIPEEIQEQCAHLDDPQRNWPPDKDLVSSIKLHGVTDVVQCMAFRKRSGDRVRVVIDGRRRTRAAREANRQLRDDHPIMVPYVVVNVCTDLTPTLMNGFRRENSPLEKAENCRRLLARGRTLEQIATCYGDGQGSMVSVQTVKNWLSLLRLPKAEQDRIAHGEMTPSEGYALASADRKTPKPPRSQREASPRPGVKALKAMAELFDPTDHETLETPEEQIASAIFTWIATGDLHALHAWPLIREQAERVMQPSKRLARVPL